MKELFANSIPYDQKVRGRMGGNPPQIIENIIPEGYGFYTTLVHPEKNDKMLSILIVKDFDELVDNNEYPNIKIKVIEHDFSEMSSNDNYCLEKLDMLSISEYYSSGSDFLYIKCFGEPRFIQDESDCIEYLKESNYSFFMMIDEEGYHKTFLGINPFGFGALYLYKHNETGEVIAGYWQYS